MRDSAHWNRIFAVFVSSREGNLQLARANDRVIKEQLVEVAQAKEEQRSRMLSLQLTVLPDHWGRGLRIC